MRFEFSNKCISGVLDQRVEIHIVNLYLHVELEGS